jgi:hypothetical protein
MITTTLNAIRACADGWTKLLKKLGKTAADNEPLPFNNRLYAVWCARQVQHLMTDPRSLAALDIAERHAHGLATDGELAAAEHAAWNAAWTIAEDAIGDAGWAAWGAALAAAKTADRDAASAAAWNAARYAAGAAQIAEFRRIVTETAA